MKINLTRSSKFMKWQARCSVRQPKLWIRNYRRKPRKAEIKPTVDGREVPPLITRTNEKGLWRGFSSREPSIQNSAVLLVSSRALHSTPKIDSSTPCFFLFFYFITKFIVGLELQDLVVHFNFNKVRLFQQQHDPRGLTHKTALPFGCNDYRTS
jgi:hypothetical protein